MSKNSNSKKKFSEKVNPVYIFRLFITGATPNSSRAITNLKLFLDKNFKDKYEMEIIDAYQHPELAKTENIIALPLLVKKFPLPERRLIGDMSDTDKIIRNFSLINSEE